ncbi:hypothetical protein HGP14_26795 [Rhizobium sp. P32RR-XVIII]|uniref:hypothetical protein n=1 Tax=Rhizobium sp. P32RR-XVIII TaxID=2726738 RepID=UPI001456466B|nr:hypothetical protein [Rhizobium sp. P32RR-XVIII]NLS06914.1 hypothetical protein [Rhizobium sp. P32RR-XVIII]
MKFEVMASTDDQTKIHIYEVYADAAFGTHLSNPSIKVALGRQGLHLIADQNPIRDPSVNVFTEALMMAVKRESTISLSRIVIHPRMIAMWLLNAARRSRAA